MPILTVNGDKKSFHFIELRLVRNRNFKLLEHDLEITLLNLVLAFVDELRLLAHLFKVPQKSVSRRKRIGIRIVVTLNGYVIKFQQLI